MARVSVVARVRARHRVRFSLHVGAGGAIEVYSFCATIAMRANVMRKPYVLLKIHSETTTPSVQPVNTRRTSFGRCC